MSQGNKHVRSIMDHPRGNITHAKPGIYKGSKFVKKAGKYLKYICFNTPNKTDVFEWSDKQV